MMKKIISTAAFTAFLSFHAMPATVTWDGDVNSNWNLDGNWSGDTKPTSSDDVVFNSGSVDCNLDVSAQVKSLTFTSGYSGAFSFQSYTLDIVTGKADFQTGGTITAGSGTLEFSASSGTTQNLYTTTAHVLPLIHHSGSGTLQFSLYQVDCNGFTSDGGGVLDFNGVNLRTNNSGDFTITNGTNSTFSNLGGALIRVKGDASFTGQSGDSLNMNPASTWTLNMENSGSVSANYAIVGNNTVQSSTGQPTNCRDAGGNTNWNFPKTWDGGGGDNNWNTAANWSGDEMPNGQAVTFNGTSTKNCDLNETGNVTDITFTSGYTGTFNFGSDTLKVTGDADFSTGGSITAGSGILQFASISAAQSLTPPSGETMPHLYKSSDYNLSISGADLTAGDVTVTGNSDMDWGDESRTHTISSLTASNGTIRFKANTIVITSGNVTLTGTDNVVASSSILNFTAAYPATQVLTPRNSTTTHPGINHSGTGTLQFSGSGVKVLSLINSNGKLDFNGYNLTTTGSFTINTGGDTTFQNLAGRTITVGGNASLNGQSGSYLNMDPASTWYINVTGTLAADYANIGYSDASGGSQGVASTAVDQDNNSNWKFGMIWDGGGGDNNWSTAANWVGDVAPISTDSVIFNSTSVKDVTLDANATIQAIIFENGYTGTFSFGSQSLTVNGNADFSGGETITPATGGLLLNGSSGTQTFTPKSGETFPAITKNGNSNVLVSGAGLAAASVSVSGGTGTWDWGDEGYSHTLTALTVSAGAIDFGNSTVTISSGNVNFNGASGLTAGTGTLAFSHASNTQQLTPKDGTTDHPALSHTGAGTLQLQAAMEVMSFSSSGGGTLDLNGFNLSTVSSGNFTITNGTDPGFGVLDGRTITVAGNASLTGSEGDSLDLDADATWYFNVSGSLSATYAVLGDCDASGGSQGQLINGRNAGNNTNWALTNIWEGDVDNQWSTNGNWSSGTKPTSSDPVQFDGTGTANCNLDEKTTVASITFTAAYTGSFNFGSDTLEVLGDADFRTGGSIVAGTGVLEFARSATGDQNFYVKSGATFPDIYQSGSRAVYLLTAALQAGDVENNSSSYLHLGSSGFTHIFKSFTMTYGRISFGTSTLELSEGDCDLSGTITLFKGTGTIEFSHASNTQVFTPMDATTDHPAIHHSGAGTLQLAGSGVEVVSFTSDGGGTLDFNGQNLTTILSGDFSLTGGSASSFTNLAGRTLTIAGNGTLTGQSGDMLDMNTKPTTHYITCSGDLQATYAVLGASDASGGSTGYTTSSADSGSNSGWEFAKKWDNDGGDGLWSTAANWSGNTVPATGQAVEFEGTSDANCTLDQNDSIAAITFTSGYNGTFSFGSYTLSVASNSDFRSGGTITPGTGTLEIRDNSLTLIPHASETLPAVLKLGSGTVTISTNALSSNGEFRIDAGTWDWGDNSLVHSVASVDVNGGTVDFGNSTLKVTGNVDLSGAASLSGTGTLEFMGSSTQTVRAWTNTQTVSYSHTTSNTLQITGNEFRGYNFTSSGGGTLDMNSQNLRMDNNLTFNSGTGSTFSNLGGQILRADGNASLNGTSGDSLNLNPTSSWTMNCGGTLTATYAIIKNSNASVSSGEATASRDAGNNTNWTFPSGAEPTPTWSQTGLGTIAGGAITDDKVLLGAGNYLRARLLSNGNEDWSYNAGATVGRPSYYYWHGTTVKIVAAAGNTIIGRQDGSGTSSQLFSPVNLGSSPGTPYISPDDTTFYVTYSGNLTKRKISDGSAVWTTAVSNVSINADPVVFSDYVYVATTTGVVQKRDAGNGAVVQTSASTGASLDQALIIQDSVLYATPATNKLYAFDMTDLSTNWNLTVSGTNSGPSFSAVASDNIYLAVGTAIQKVTDNTTSGASVWSQDFSVTVNSGPIEYNSIVYFGRNSGRYYAVSASTGNTVGDWPYYSASGDADSGPWIDVTNNRVIFGTTGGNLHAFALE